MYNNVWVGFRTQCFSIGWKPVKHAVKEKLVLLLSGDLTGFQCGKQQQDKPVEVQLLHTSVLFARV